MQVGAGSNGGRANVSRDLTIRCGGGECAMGILPFGLNAQSCTVWWKFTLGVCIWGGSGRQAGARGGEKASWSLASASMFWWPFRLFILLMVDIRSLKAFTISSTGVIVGCMMYLCLK